MRERDTGVIDTFTDLPRVIAHEAGHAVVAWATPSLPMPTGIYFEPLWERAGCTFAAWPVTVTTEDYLEFASLFLGGFAGEKVALGDFHKLLKSDFEWAVGVARVVRRMGTLPWRREATAFRARLPRRLHARTKGFLNDAYDLAVARIEKHRDAHQRLIGWLSRGYCVDRRIEFDGAEIASWLGPRP